MIILLLLVGLTFYSYFKLVCSTYKSLIININTNYNKMIPHANPMIAPIIEQTNNIFSKAYKSKYKNEPDLDVTVICSISLVNKKINKFQVVSVGFGTKSLPYLLAKTHKSKVIRDMHAQILARRGFLHFLIKKLPKKEQQNDIFSWDGTKRKHQLKSQYQVVLFSNQIFCGDCMTNQTNGLYSGARPLKYFSQKQIPQDQYIQHCLRTKPGRLDLPLQKRSLSLSCSDKIGLWNILGIQGKMLFNYIKPIYIDMIIIESSHKIQPIQISEGINFTHRISKLFHLPLNQIINKLFKIVIDGKVKFISNQFRNHEPKVTVVHKQKALNTNLIQKQDKKLQICGVISEQQTSWLGGKTGLPQGVSLSKINKISPFCSQQLYDKLESNEKEEFKYHAVKNRVKLLFKEWTDNYKQK